MILRSFLGLLLGMAFADAAFAQGWGNVKGQVVWANPVAAAPVNLLAGVAPANIPPCVKGGGLPSDELLIDKNTKGVANALIWIAAVEDADPTEIHPKAIPVHPDLRAIPKDNVVIDQPCCLFTPRILMFREGQVLEVRNSAVFNHSFAFSGHNEINASVNSNIPAGGKATFTLKAQKKPIPISCAIHGWMKGELMVLNHPYFTTSKKDGTFEIKNAPAGKFLVFVFHESKGYLQEGNISKGQQIEIKAGGTLDLDTFDLK